MNYFLKATNAKGETAYYTGRAGEGWVSPDPRLGFAYWGAEATRKADLFNQNTSLHGWTFQPEPVPAEVPKNPVLDAALGAHRADAPLLAALDKVRVPGA